MRVDGSAMAVLERCKVDGCKLFLPPEKLDRKLYESVNKVLDAMGGKWNRSAKAHVFAEDPSDLLEQVLDTGEITSLKKELQYFPTPDAVVGVMLARLGWEKGEIKRVLEPSAGEGAIAGRLKKAGMEVDVCELHEPFRKKLAEEGFKVLQEKDFLRLVVDKRYDAVVANPPFSKQQDVDHVSKMLDAVKPGGALVSVMSAGITFRQNAKTKALKEKLDEECLSWRIEELPEGSFKGSGTAVNAVILIAVKN